MALAADRKPFDTYKVGIEMSFESEFDPVAAWPSGPSTTLRWTNQRIDQ
jgi:hypothetical protein